MKLKDFTEDLILFSEPSAKEYEVRMIMTAPDGTQIECDVKEWVYSDRTKSVILIGSNFDRGVE